MKHMRTLSEMIWKHFRIIVRSRTTLLTILLGPLLITLIVGFAFNSQSLQSIDVAIYVNDGSNQTNISKEVNNPAILEINDLLNDSFTIVYVDSPDNCIRGVKLGLHHTCIELPYNLDPENDLVDNDVKIYVDLTEVNLAYSLLNSLSNIVSLETRRLSVQFTDKLINEIQSSEKTLTTDSGTIKSAYSGIQDSEASFNSARQEFNSMSFDITSDLSSLNDLINTVNSLSDDLTNLGMLADVIKEDHNSTIIELASKENDFENDCSNNSNTYCDELMLEIDNLEERESLLSSYTYYLSEIDSASLDDSTSTLLTISYDVNSASQEIDSNLQEASSLKDSGLSYLNDGLYSLRSANYDVSDVHSDVEDLLRSYSGIRLTDSNRIVNPLNISVETVADEGTYLDYSFPLILRLVICFLGILLSSGVIMMEKKSRAFFRNYITPANEAIFLTSVFIVMLSIMLVDLLIVTGVSLLFFNFSLMLVSVPATIIACILISTVFIFIGMSIGFLFADEEGATIASIFISTVLFLFSPIIIPLENMSRILSNIAQFSPLVSGQELLRKIILFNLSLSESWFHVIILLVYILILVFIIFSSHEFHKKRL